MRGKLTISIDLELAWGVWDILTPEYLRLAEDAERPICAALIDLLDRHGIGATWAMVAALLDEKSAETQPGAKSCWYAPDIVERLVGAQTRHEIGTHSGRHIYFDRISAAEAEDDLSFACEIHTAHGLGFGTMVFPRNEVAHLPILSRFGLGTFRGPDADKATALRKVSTPLGQAAHLAGQVVPLPPPAVAATRRDGLIDVPGSMLLIGRNGARRFVLPSVTRAKLKLGLDRARQRGGIFHLWFHPSNFYYRREEQFETLDWFLDYAAREARNGGIEIRTLGSYAEMSGSQTVSESK